PLLPPRSVLFPYTTLFRSALLQQHFGPYTERADGSGVHRNFRHGIPCLVFLGERQAGFDPGRQATLQAIDFLEALALERLRDAHGGAATLADDDDGLAFGQAVELVVQVGCRHVARLRHGACLDVLDASHIEEPAVARVGQLDCVVHAELPRAAIEEAGQRQRHGRGDDDDNEQYVGLVGEKVHGVFRKYSEDEGAESVDYKMDADY